MVCDELVWLVSHSTSSRPPRAILLITAELFRLSVMIDRQLFKTYPPISRLFWSHPLVRDHSSTLELDFVTMVFEGSLVWPHIGSTWIRPWVPLASVSSSSTLVWSDVERATNALGRISKESARNGSGALKWLFGSREHFWMVFHLCFGGYQKSSGTSDIDIVGMKKLIGLKYKTPIRTR